MDLPQQRPPAPSSLLTSYVDEQDQSVPPTPLSPISPTYGLHNAPKGSGFPWQAPYPPPAVTSSSPVKPVKRKRLAKVSDRSK